MTVTVQFWIPMPDGRVDARKVNIEEKTGNEGFEILQRFMDRFGPKLNADQLAGSIAVHTPLRPDHAAGGVGAESSSSSPPPTPRPGVRDTSMVAYRAMQWSGKLTNQQKMVRDFFVLNPQRDFTRQELGNALGLGINVICGRVNELMKDPFMFFEERAPRKCRITKESAKPLTMRRAA